MSRKRIVIDFDAPAPGASRAATRKSRVWPRVLGVLFALVLVGVAVVGIVGFFLWRHYQSTPAYALALIIDAAQRGDVAEFQKRLDDDQIAGNMVAAVSEKATARYGLALSNQVRAQIDSTLPSLMQELKPAIRDEVAKEIQAFASMSQPRPFILLVVGVPSLMTITTEGETAKASGMINERRFELAMRQSSDGWKVTGYNDDVVIQRVVDRLMTRLPAIGEFEKQFQSAKPSKRSKRRR